MTTKGVELINALISGLKIEEDVYAIETVKESVELLSENVYLDFYQAVMKEDTFGNGVKAVMKIAEQFKPQIQEVDETELKAKELIDLVQSMNKSIDKDHIRTGINFDRLLKDVNFPSVGKEDIAILNQVRPHYDMKTLIAKINHYATAKECIEAFKRAIKLYGNSDQLMIDSYVRKMIRR